MGEIFGNYIIHRHKINYQRFGLKRTPKNVENGKVKETPPRLEKLSRQNDAFFNQAENKVSKKDFETAEKMEERYAQLLGNSNIKDAIVQATNNEWANAIKGYSYTLHGNLYPMLRNQDVRDLFQIRQKIQRQCKDRMKNACKGIGRSSKERLKKARKTSEILLNIIENIESKTGYTEKEIATLENLFQEYDTNLQDIKEKLKINKNIGGRETDSKIKEINDILEMFTVLPNVSGKQGEIGEILSAIADDNICSILGEFSGDMQDDLIKYIQKNLNQEFNSDDSKMFLGNKYIDQEGNQIVKKSYNSDDVTIDTSTEGEKYRRKTDVAITFNGEKMNLSVKNLKDFDRSVSLVSKTPFDRILKSIDNSGEFAAHYANLRVNDSGISDTKRKSSINYSSYKKITNELVNAQTMKIALKGYVKDDYTKFLVVLSREQVKVIPINAILQHYKNSNEDFSISSGVQRLNSKSFEHKPYEDFTKYVENTFNKRKISVHINNIGELYSKIKKS